MPRQNLPKNPGEKTSISQGYPGDTPPFLKVASTSPLYSGTTCREHAPPTPISLKATFKRKAPFLIHPSPPPNQKLSLSSRLPTHKQPTSEIMGIFMRLVDYAEDTKLLSYSVFPAILGLLFLGLFLFLKKEWSIHSSTKFPIVGIESPGYFWLVKAREKFVSDALQIVKNGYYKVSLHTICSIISHRPIKIRQPV